MKACKAGALKKVFILVAACVIGYVSYEIFLFIRLMRRWTKQIRALELFGEKNRLGRGSNLGQAEGNLCLWGPERFFSVVRASSAVALQEGNIRISLGN